MSVSTSVMKTAPIEYPESDGQPMADNTVQFRWIMTLQGGLDALFRDRPDVFVAGDLLWYPVEGNNRICIAPDVMVVFGRPKGDRGRYLQWEEGGIAPQVAFEIRSPGNTLTEMARKFEFYDEYGVEEYYLYDPQEQDLTGWRRANGRLRVIEEIRGWISPRLQVRFEIGPEGLEVYRPDGRKFETFVEIEARAEQERAGREHAEARVEQERQGKERAQAQAEQERQRAERLAARLRESGVKPEE